MGRPSTWFIPFCLVLAILTAPIAVRDPLISVPALLAATIFGAHMLWRDREPEGLPHPVLSAAWMLLALVSIGMVSVAVWAALD